MLFNTDHIMSLFKEKLAFETSRSGGKGGQHVNKVETKVTLVLDLDAIPSLSDDVLEKLKEAEHRYINYPIIRISSAKTRSQLKNKKDTTEKLQAFLEEVLVEEKERKETKVPRAVKAKRLKNKKNKSEIKSTRKKINPKDL